MAEHENESLESENAEPTSKTNGHNPNYGSVSLLSPRQIQQRLRGGDSLENIAHAAGTTLSYIEKFSGAILDELEYILEKALDTPVVTVEQNTDEPVTFGLVIEQRLKLIYNTTGQWKAWRDIITNAWVIQVQYASEKVDYDARWNYEPKRQILNPLNKDAENLSSVSPNHPSVRLHSVTAEQPSNISRFDSAAFKPDISQADTLPHNDPIPYGREGNDAVITQLYRNTAEDITEVADSEAETEELLDMLNRKRGERDDTLSFSPEEYEDIDIPLTDFDEDTSDSVPADELPIDDSLELDWSVAESESADGLDNSAAFDSADFDSAAFGSADIDTDAEETPTERSEPAAKAQKNQTNSYRRGRQAIPSWDEIVFGTKSEDD